MQTVQLSQVGGLTTEVLAKMAERRLALLTLDKVPRAVALPYITDKQLACQVAQQYIALAGGDGACIRVGRLKGSLQAKLAVAGALVVTRRGCPSAVLLPPPADQRQAEQGAKVYLEELGVLQP